MRRLLALAILVAATALAILTLAGCGLKSITRPKSVPHTFIFIQGPVDTVNHIVDIHWFGSDPSGYIVGFEVRLLNPVAPTDSAWRFTTRMDSLITVLAPGGITSAVFEARAINDRGVRDPKPARQSFNFRNHPPIVTLIGKPNAGERSDTTFASVTVDWTVSDLDGDASKVVVRTWLDGHADAPLIATGTRLTMPSAQFLKGGAFLSGFRKLFIQGIDDGGMAGPIDSVQWYVRQPVSGPRARLLLVEDVDDVPTASKQSPPARFRTDTLYANAITRAGLDPGSWSMLRLDLKHPFRSSKDLEQTLKQFETVVWYRGEQSVFSNVLANYGDGIGPYLDAGGRVFIESLNLTTEPNNAGGLSEDFVSRYLNSDGVFQFPTSADSSAAWGMSSARAIVLHSPILADSLLNLRNVVGLRAFHLRSASQALLIAPAHGLSEDNPFDMALGLDVPQAGGGRLVVNTYPAVSASISQAAFPQRASLFLFKVLGLLGLTGP